MKNRILLLLAAYDYESLYIALESIDKTVCEDEDIVIVLNGKRGIRSALVEETARDWAAKHPEHRHIVKPLSYGKEPYYALTEVIDEFPLLKKTEFICKIDDDLIPLKKGWLDDLQDTYVEKEKEYGQIGFVTSLINNNAWGFNKLLDIFDKRDEYKSIMNFKSISGTGNVKAGEVADGYCGTVWQYPYLAKWIHSWTLLKIVSFINKTDSLPTEEIDINTHYSIGCLFFRRELWLKLKGLEKDTVFDELMIHLHCKNEKLKKIAVMNQPMGHLFYYNQRQANCSLLPDVRKSLCQYWGDNIFEKTKQLDTQAIIKIEFESQNYIEEINRIVNASSFFNFIKRKLKK